MTPLVSVVVIGRNEGDRLARCLQSVRAVPSPLNDPQPPSNPLSPPTSHLDQNHFSLIDPQPASNPLSPPTSYLDQNRFSLNEPHPPSNLLSPPASYLDQNRFSLELIYVDSGSTDNSLALAESLGAQVIALHPDRPTAALGRNAGWRAARGEIMLFLDGDTELDPRFIAAALPSFADPRTAVVWGHRREKQPFLSGYDRTLDLDWIYPPGPAPFCGGDALFRRDVLEQTGGFDDTLVAGEEPELCARIIALGFTVLHVDLPMTLHVLGIRSFRQYWKRATRAGHAYAEVAARFAGTANPLWSADVRRNRRRAGFLLALAAAGVSASLAIRSLWPLIAALVVLAALVLRTAWKARWKSHSLLTLLLYGIHSHFQQIPIASGQLQFAANHRKGRRAHVFDYKRHS